MDIEKIIDEALKRFIENIKIPDKKLKFLQCKNEKLELLGFEGVFLESKLELEDMSNYEFLIVEELSINEMIAASIGITINKKTEVIQKSFLNSKKVYYLQDGLEYLKYKESSNKMYFKNLSEYEKKLTSFGFVPLKQFEDLKTLLSKNDVMPSQRKQKTLITEIIAMEMLDKKKIFFNQNTLITPAAQDIFRNNNIGIFII